MSDDPRAPSGTDDTAPMSAAELRAYLGSPDVGAHIRAMARRKVPRQDVDDVLGDAFAKMCATASRPAKIAVGGWVETSALNAITDHLRRRGRRAGRETVVEDVDDMDPGVDPVRTDRIEWLRKRVQKSRIDAETLALLESQAELGLTRAEVAARAGMEEETLKKRTQRFRAKYADEWKRERTRLAVLLLAGLALAIAVGWVALGRGKNAPPVGPGPGPPASASTTSRIGDHGGPNVASPPPPRGSEGRDR